MKGYNPPEKTYEWYSNHWQDGNQTLPEGFKITHYSFDQSIPLNDDQYDPLESSPNIKLYGDSLAQRIFGPQLARTQQTGNQLDDFLDKRTHLYQQHMAEFHDWLNDLKNQLSFARRPYTVGAPQQAQNLERLIFQVETQKRREQHTFWKDVTELRENVLVSALESQATKHRASLLTPKRFHYG